MGLQLNQFDYMSYNEDVGIEWKKWLRSFEIMIRASRITDDEWKFDLLLHYAGPSVQNLYESLPQLPEFSLRGPLANIDNYTPNMTGYEEAVTKLNNFFLPKENLTYERHLFRQMKQKSDENIDGFSVRLRMQAARCGFGNKMDENIKDQVIQNCQSVVLRRDLLKRGDTDLQDILRVAKIFETVAHQEKSFNPSLIRTDPKSSVEEVDKISVKPFNSNNHRARYTQLYGNRKFEGNGNRGLCFRCGYTGHSMNDKNCPARGKVCNRCGGRDHFSKRCRSQVLSGSSQNKPGVYFPKEMKEGKSDNSNNAETIRHVTSEEYIFNVTSVDGSNEIQCEIGGIGVTAIIDSGSKYNLMGQNIWEMLKSHKILVSNQRKDILTVFRAYGGQELAMLGAFSVDMGLCGQHKIVDFYVIRGNGKILIGRDTAIQMGILKFNTSVNEIEVGNNQKQFGKIKGVVIDIPLRPDAKPVVQPYRRIPVALEKAVDNKIDNLLWQGIIEKVNQPSRWCISQTTGQDWLRELNKYLLMYRSTRHSSTHKTPSELLFGRNTRDEIPSIHQPMEVDEETADTDRINKEKGKQYTDNRRHAKEIHIGEGDTVLVKRMVKLNKLSTNFEPWEYTVIDRKGGEVIIESLTGKRYRRNVSHLQKVNRTATDTLNQHSAPYSAEQSQQSALPVKDKSIEKESSTSRLGRELSPSRLEPEPSTSRQSRQIQRPSHLKDFVLDD